MGPDRQGDAAASAHAVFFAECDVAGGCACDVRVHTFAWSCRQAGTGVRAAGQGSTTALRAIPRSNEIATHWPLRGKTERLVQTIDRERTLALNARSGTNCGRRSRLPTCDIGFD